jgi:S-adenosylmethionine/arginine decarboxylase-like enzyme
MSVQYLAAASQKFTCPGVTGVVPVVTVAVSVTTLPEATVVMTLPPEVTASVATP